jgi:F0F1-type ATP synthase membrane subunit b/b'
MEIFRQLGVNETLWIHLACFLFSYVVLTQLILKPYFRAFLEREKRTVGSEEAAVRLSEEANDLQTQYGLQARDLNAKMKGLYDDARLTAQKQSDVVVGQARTQATALLQQNREQIAGEVSKAQKTLAAEIPAVGSAIASKLAGKDLSL